MESNQPQEENKSTPISSSMESTEKLLESSGAKKGTKTGAIIMPMSNPQEQNTKLPDQSLPKDRTMELRERLIISVMEKRNVDRATAEAIADNPF